MGVTVTSGLFNVGLGDTSLTNMAALTLTTPFDTTATQPFTLRLWFNDGVKGFQQLAPDQALHSVPFSRVAATVRAAGSRSVRLFFSIAVPSRPAKRPVAPTTTASPCSPGPAVGL